MRLRADHVVPFAMKLGGLEQYGVELFAAYTNAGLVRRSIERRLNPQSFGARRIADQVHHHFATGQRPSAPVGRNVTEHAVLDLVPFAGAGRKVTDVNLNSAVESQKSLESLIWCGFPAIYPRCGAVGCF